MPDKRGYTGQEDLGSIVIRLPPPPPFLELFAKSTQITNFQSVLLIFEWLFLLNVIHPLIAQTRMEMTK